MYEQYRCFALPKRGMTRAPTDEFRQDYSIDRLNEVVHNVSDCVLCLAMLGFFAIGVVAVAVTFNVDVVNVRL